MIGSIPLVDPPPSNSDTRHNGSYIRAFSYIPIMPLLQGGGSAYSMPCTENFERCPCEGDFAAAARKPGRRQDFAKKLGG